MKYVLILMMMLSSYSVMARSYFESKAEVLEDSPLCSNVLSKGVEGTAEFAGYFCSQCKDGAKAKKVNLKGSIRNVTDNKKNKVKDTHYRCSEPKVKDSKFFYCDAESKKVKKVKAKNESEASAEVGGSKIYTSKSDAKKDPACIKIKDKKFFYCDASTQKVVSVKAKSESEISSASGAKIYTSKSEAKKDPKCNVVELKPFAYCDKNSGKVVEIQAESKKAAKKLSNNNKVYSSVEKAAKDKHCRPVDIACKVVDALEGFIAGAELDKKSVKDYKRACKDIKGDFDQDKSANTCSCTPKVVKVACTVLDAVGSFAKDAQLSKAQVKDYKQACKDAKGSFTKDKDADTCACSLPTEIVGESFSCFYCDPREDNKVWELTVTDKLASKYGIDAKSSTRCEDITSKKVSKKTLVDEEAGTKFRKDYKEIRKFLSQDKNLWAKAKVWFSKKNVEGFKLSTDRDEARRASWCTREISGCIVNGKTLLKDEVEKMAKDTEAKNKKNDGFKYSFDRATCTETKESVGCSNEAFKSEVVKLADSIFNLNKENFTGEIKNKTLVEFDKTISVREKAFSIDFLSKLNQALSSSELMKSNNVVASINNSKDEITVVDGGNKTCRAYVFEKSKLEESLNLSGYHLPVEGFGKPVLWGAFDWEFENLPGLTNSCKTVITNAIETERLRLNSVKKCPQLLAGQNAHITIVIKNGKCASAVLRGQGFYCKGLDGDKGTPTDKPGKNGPISVNGSTDANIK